MIFVSFSDGPSSKRPHLEDIAPPDLKRSKLGNIDINSEKFKEMIDKKSLHTNLVEVSINKTSRIFN